jgi:hypothetical protein
MRTREGPLPQSLVRCFLEAYCRGLAPIEVELRESKRAAWLRRPDFADILNGQNKFSRSVKV